ncbi:hypothetical protein DM867_00475 [Halosegnis rubeus]|jgi:hypothetical protein|uniref:Uncharacterized protein n=1 Tax=Halosegnis rubeus TaxID=2212850 RepID=A0A5N5UAS1_9EURY|nr:DUF5778 family protein [Halosegnis rubeus]KAB7515657.1 hypothetical protein DM867_00475 [Halosegnis rubeus]KAB7517137.1 hypothetical protein DMP03_07205 [Halosegnis rubeus]KAB7519744.1 hypothetical protein DP108_00370 [Halosegnis rubeus]
MSDVTDRDLYQRAKALLEPGDIELNGLIVHTDLTGEEEPTLHQLTLDVGETITEHAGLDPADTYVYSGNDDPDFGVNQHQGRTLDGDEFVWECQQLMREQHYEVVFYYEASADQDGIISDLDDDGRDVTSVPGE